MARELLIFRHGKSDWGSDTRGDFHRPLARRGRKAVKRMAAWLRDQNCLPEQILSSPAERARQTTLMLCRHAELPESIVVWEDAIYEADLRTLLQVLGRHAGGPARVMMVGHNPGLEELVAYLAGAPPAAPADHPAMPTAAIAHMQMPDAWQTLERGCARLISVTRPRELDES